MTVDPPFTSPVEAAAYIADQARQHDEVRQLVIAITSQLGSLTELAEEDPQHLIELAEAVLDMNRQAPIAESMAWNEVWGND